MVQGPMAPSLLLLWIGFWEPKGKDKLAKNNNHNTTDVHQINCICVCIHSLIVMKLA